MNDFLETLSDFIGGIIATAILGGSILLIAGEIQLAALKKARNGSVRLSDFTERMTKTRLPIQR
jgi:hypothetical protein